MSKKKKTIDELLEEAIVPEDEQPFEIPNNWVWTEIKYILKPMLNTPPSKLNIETFHYIDVESIDNKKQELRAYKELSTCEAPSRAQRKVAKNDVLISLVRPYLKNIAKINFQDEKLIASTAFYVCSVKQGVNAKYLYYYLMSPCATEFLIKHTKGDNSPSVRSGEFELMPIPIGAINEQKRIADKIEILFAKADEAKKMIKDVKESFEVRKQAILRDAFQGKFTNTQREEGKSIRFENKDKFLNDKKPSFKIPQEWQWIRLGELIDSISDYHANGSYKVLKEHVELLDTPDYALMIRATNFEKNNFETLNKYITKSAYEFLSKSKLFGGEILMSKIGNTGSVYLMPKLNKPCSLAMNLFSMRVNEAFDNEYIYFYLNSPMGKANINKYIKGVTTTSIDKISVKSIYIPLPSRKEQDLIVKKVKALLELEEQISKNIILELEEKVENVKQSILSKAFKGELVTNDSTDVPAINLLKSMLQEKL